MTKEMKELYDNLDQVKVKNVVGAYDYIGQAINEMDYNGTLDFEMTVEARKRISKDLKTLKKHYKGKIKINPETFYRSYKEGSQERFFFECLVKLMAFNNL